MIVGIFVAEFFLLLNTSPLNAAVINSVGPHIRATALAVNIFIFHLLGDVPSAALIGALSDSYSLQSAFLCPSSLWRFLLPYCFMECDLPRP